MILKFFFTTILFLMILFCIGFAQINKPSDTMPTFSNIDYVGHGNPKQMLDIYIPDGLRKKAPLIVHIHGGAWLGGSKRKSIGNLDIYLERGYVVADINYRLSQDSLFPAQIYDCKTAIRYLKANAKKYKIDPDRIGVIGESAGGHLVALLGTSAKEESLEGLHLGSKGFSSAVHAVVDLYGPTDFLQMDAHIPQDCTNPLKHDSKDSPESKLLGCYIKECPEKVSLANPITYINGNEPPFLIQHGEADCTVPAHQSELLYEALKSKGQHVELKLYPGVGHGGKFWNQEKNKKFTADFFDKCLK